MIGIKYLRYHPKAVFQLPSGLTIYKSAFTNADGGGQGVIGGPHHIFNTITTNNTNAQLRSFLSNQLKMYESGVLVNPDITLLHNKVEKDHQKNLMYEMKESQDVRADALLTRNQKIFEQAEEAGSIISYRCVDCRGCQTCKENEAIESISIKEEVEQDLINKSITVDISNRTSWAHLPLIHDPHTRLANNRDKALRVYYQQLRKLDKEPSDKDDVIKSQAKLQSMGFVDYVKNLPKQQQDLLSNHDIQNFIPWRAVWKGNSISTPCRVVFDASQPTSTGYSLNDVVAKGTNNMNRLVEILIRWTSHQTAFHTDVSKMYNSVKLHEEHWCLQRYIWQEELNSSKLPEEKVIKTLIYGVKSSGNQAERALRQTGQVSKNQYPEVCDIINKDVYVDDCLSGAESNNIAQQRADELKIVVNRGGFALKGFTFSKEPPNADLSTDGECIHIAGMRWFPEEDVVSLDVTELNFAKKSRGKKPAASSNQIPSRLTRRHCVSKVAELYGITGKVSPITAAMKLDLHQLVDRGLDWDDKIPDEFRQIWESNFAMMEEISSIKYQRAIVPEDAVSLDINTIDTGDASREIACSAIYARFRRKSGKFSCQLVFSRTKLIPCSMTQPRAELFAATLNAHTGEVVRRSFSKHHTSAVKLTDSQITMFWISSNHKQLKPWTRNRVVEIQRLTQISNWKFVASEDMIADIATRRGASIEDVMQSSTWINGFDWMTEDVEDLPTKTVKEIKLSQEETNQYKKEMQLMFDSQPLNLSLEQSQYSTFNASIGERYKHSQYIIDPNKFSWSRILRITNLVLDFIKRLKHQVSTAASTTLATKNAEEYFFRKATQEIITFVPEQKYTKISKLKDDILYYTGRILPTNEVTSTGRLTNIMIDLSSTMFCVPIVDRKSPIAFSIVNHVHWYHKVAMHAGVETVLRYVLQIAYIIDGRELVKQIRKKCCRCRYIAKKTIEVEMGPTSSHHLNIAPPFYSTQVDLCGPFNAYSNFHKRTKVKIWLTVFCCTTTSATKIKIMDDYSTPSFILAFTRFASDVGYPMYLLPDEGSQLVKGCQDMRLNFKDIQDKLFCDVQVQFNVCPVGGHHMHGKVERKIREVKRSLTTNLHNERLSIIQWETIAAQISNMINDRPLAISNCTDHEIADILTPNRLLMGRNNHRSPAFPVEITSSPDRFIKANQRIMDAWFEVWLTTHVPKLMYQPKWFKNEDDLKVGDIVLFAKRENALCNTYQYGKIKSVEKSQDGRIRKTLVEYRNSNEDINRVTYRAVRSLIMIHPVDELSISEELTMSGLA